MNANVDQDALTAAVDLVGRSGASSVEIGYLERIFDERAEIDLVVDPCELAQSAYEYAWAAGFFDGEGSTSHSSGGARPSMQQASDTGPPETLLRLQSILGGRVVYRKHPAPNRKPLYAWTLTGRENIERSLRKMWPWLGEVKRAQARRAMSKYVGREEWIRRISESAKRRWADPEWRRAHPDAIDNLLAVRPRAPCDRDPTTGRFIKRR